MLETITSVNGVVNGIVWGPVGLALLFGTGFVMSVRTGFFQFGHFRYWLRNTIGAIFTDRDITAHTEKNDKAISQFQSLCTALAATIGTGNIVGVATAILSGGPGAIFWMWAMAILGMMTNYSENVLGIFYRRKNADGEWSGGAMYYLADGLGSKKGCKKLGRVLAVLFACFCVLASFGIGNMSQINSIAGNMNAAFQVPNLLTGILLAVLSALVILGGLKRVAAVTEKVVPLMALFYILGALTVVLTHVTAIPAAFAAIFKGAFAMQAAGGGVLGYGVSRAITWGFKRGAFSNEAGLGSSVMVHASSNVKEPVQQGMWGIFEVFADTIVVCTLTALVILTSGFVDLNTGRMLTEVQGSALVGEAFSTVFGSFGPKFIAVSILLFAYSTVLGWSHYGTKAFEYLFGTKASMGYKVVFVAMVLVGATMKLDLAWDLSDTFNGLMMLPNLIGVLSLSGTVAAITRNYVDHKFHGKRVEPMWSAFAEYQKEEEAEEATLDKAALTALFAARVPLLPGRTPADFWTGLLNPKLGRALWAAARLPDTPLDTLPDAAWQVLANTAKHWLFEDLTPCGWKQAQTTGGGLSLTELEPSFQFKGCPGLYFVGETLDCAGMCGGFNLHWAFGSGITAGRDAVRTLRRPHKKR